MSKFIKKVVLENEFKKFVIEAYWLLKIFIFDYENSETYGNGVIVDISSERVSVFMSSRGIKIKTWSNMKIIPLDNNSWLNQLDRAIAKQNGVALEGKGHIYLVSDGENTKIGATTYNPTKRLNELQVGNAKKLTLIGSYQVERRIATESMLHEIYQDKNIRGEWFSLSGNDIVDILNKRTQSSVNSEYQVLTTKDVDKLLNALQIAKTEFNEHLNIKLKRLRQKIKIHIDGTPVQQVKWCESIVKELGL